MGKLPFARKYIDISIVIIFVIFTAWLKTNKR